MFTGWLTSLDQSTLDALRSGASDHDVDWALPALAPTSQGAADRPALLRSLLAFYIAHDHGRWQHASEALATLTHSSNLPRSTLALFAASLALKQGDTAAAWSQIEPVSQQATVANPQLADLWLRLSEGRQEDSKRREIFARWLQHDAQLNASALAWQHLGTLAVNCSDLSGAIRAFRTGVQRWLNKPMRLPAKPRSAVIVDCTAATQDLLRLLVELRKSNLIAFPIAGTLLGLEREGHLLPRDKDADLACPANALPALDSWLRQRGWQAMTRKPVFANYFSYQHPQWPIALDLFPHYPGPDGGFISGWWLEGGKREDGRATRFPPYTLGARMTDQGEITYPAEPAQLLETIYGNWQTPDPHFDTVVMAHNLVARTPMVVSYAYAHLLTSLLEANWAKAKGYAQWLAASDQELAERVTKHLERIQ